MRYAEFDSNGYCIGITSGDSIPDGCASIDGLTEWEVHNQGALRLIDGQINTNQVPPEPQPEEPPVTKEQALTNIHELLTRAAPDIADGIRDNLAVLTGV